MNLRRLLSRKPDVTPTDGQVPVYDAATDQHRYEDKASGGGGTGLHADLTDVGTDDHHTRYTDAEAIAAVGTPTVDELFGVDSSVAPDDATLNWQTSGNLLHPRAWPGSAGMTGLLDYCRDNALSPTASQSTTYSTFVASEAIDGDDTGTSLSATDNTNGANWWMVEAPAGYAFKPTHWGINTYPDDARPSTFTIEGSVNGTDWVTLYSHAANLASGAWNSGALTLTGETLYTHLRISQPDNGNVQNTDQLTLREVEFWGDIAELGAGPGEWELDVLAGGPTVVTGLPDTGWQYIGDTGKPAFENSWENYGSWGNAAYRRVGDVVYLTGLIRNGLDNATIFTLPEGYWHCTTVNGNGSHIYGGATSPGNDAFARINVGTGGAVQANGVDTGWVSLNGIRFLTDDAFPAETVFPPVESLITADAFPLSPVIGMRVKRSDLYNEVFEYDGTRWLGEPRLIVGEGFNGLAAMSDWFMTPVGDYASDSETDVYIERFVGRLYVSVTSDASNYWGFNFLGGLRYKTTGLVSGAYRAINEPYEQVVSYNNPRTRWEPVGTAGTLYGCIGAIIRNIGT